MDDVFSSIVTLIPIALIIGVRILAARKKAADKKVNENLAQYIKSIGVTQSSPLARGSHSIQWPQGAQDRAPQEAAKKSTEVFSAHDLVPDDDSLDKPLLRESRAALIEALAKNPRAHQALETTADRLLQDRSESVAVQSVASVASFPDEGPQSAEAVFTHAVHSGGPKKQLKDLPPLQHAVVMAELLSSPLSLREDF